jgi:hypothetical protein
MSKMDFGLVFIPSLRHIVAIESERQKYQRAWSDLLGLLQRHQRCLATDPRDKVFAFCGLTTKMPDGLTINYHIDVASVYREVAIAILRHERHLDLVSQPPSLNSTKMDGLPSWVPDWSHNLTIKASHAWGLEALSLARKTVVDYNGEFQAFQFAATKDTVYELQLSKCRSRLEVYGYVFDKITEIGDVFEGMELPQPALRLMDIALGWLDIVPAFKKAQLTLLGWEDIASSRSKTKYITGEDVLDAYWKTFSTADYPHSLAVGMEIDVWDKLNRLAWRLRKHHIQFLVLPYCITEALWRFVTKAPVFKFYMQGHYALHRKLIKTSRGYIGVASSSVKVGSSVVMCKGSKVPLVFQHHEDGKSWQLVGDAYVHGIMQGEAFDEKKCIVMTIR